MAEFVQRLTEGKRSRLYKQDWSSRAHWSHKPDGPWCQLCRRFHTSAPVETIGTQASGLPWSLDTGFVFWHPFFCHSQCHDYRIQKVGWKHTVGDPDTAAPCRNRDHFDDHVALCVTIFVQLETCQTQSNCTCASLGRRGQPYCVWSTDTTTTTFLFIGCDFDSTESNCNSSSDPPLVGATALTTVTVPRPATASRPQLSSNSAAWLETRDVPLARKRHAPACCDRRTEDNPSSI